MIKKLTYPLLLLLFLASLLYSGCVKNESCLPANNLLSADFYEYVEMDTAYVEVAVDSLTMFIVGREDSVLYKNVKELNSISIPMSDSLSFLKVVVKINDVVDTLYIEYRPYSVFRSTECGVINRYEILNIDYTKNRILGIIVDNKDIDETEAVNLAMRVDLN